MATKAAERPKPRLSKLDELFKLDEANNQPAAKPAVGTEASEQPQDTIFTIMPFSLMDDYPGHPFRLYEGERKADMVDSIRDKGILQPLILRDKETGRYDILSGHNRKYCGIEAGRNDAPVIIKKNLSDEEAWIYVVETNLIQRSFADMSHSEKATVLSVQHSKLFSQGKRNDILAEIKRLENPHEINEKATSAEFRKSSDTRKTLAKEYSLNPNQIALYLRVQQLIGPLKIRLDNDEFPLSATTDLSFLKEAEQKAVDKCMELNGFKVDVKKAAILRSYSDRGKLNDDNMYLILNGELGQPPKKKRAPTFKIKSKVYSLYFSPGQKASEVEEVIEKALSFYFNHQDRNREQETARQVSQPAHTSDDDAEHDHDGDELEL